MDQVDPITADSNIDHEYARMKLDEQPPGSPGLEIVDDRSGQPYTPETIPTNRTVMIDFTYRNQVREPTAYASMHIYPSGRRVVQVLVADKDKGAGYGAGLLKVVSALARFGANKVSSVYSRHTYNMLKNLKRFLDDYVPPDDEGGTTMGMSLIPPDLFDKARDLGKRMKVRTGVGMGGSPKMTPAEQAVYQRRGPTNLAKEAINLPTTITTTLDYSAPGRQGLPLFFTRDFWHAARRMYKGGWSPEFFDQIDDEIRRKDIFAPVRRQDGTMGPSFAQRSGMDLMAPGHKAGPREEATASRWAETGGFLGPETVKVRGVDVINPVRALYKHTLGRPVRGANRAYITFLNLLRANRFERLVLAARDMSLEGLRTGKAPMQGLLGGEEIFGKRIGLKRKYTPEEAMELNPFQNDVLAKEIADFVNTATGRGPLKAHIVPWKKAEVNLEGAADKLAYVLFSPRLTASRLRMLNPNTYLMASPFVRKQYLKSVLQMGAAWYMFTELAKMASPDVEVNDQNLTSADYGKIRIGDFRMDPAGSFQQFLVAYGRVWQGGYTSSASQRFYKFGQGFQAETMGSIGERIASNKLNPASKFVWDLLWASQYRPMHVGDRTIQLFTPLVIQDMVELYNEDPNLLPWMAPIMHGWGTQVYSKGESVSKFLDPENDKIWRGGGLRDMLPFTEEF